MFRDLEINEDLQEEMEEAKNDLIVIDDSGAYPSSASTHQPQPDESLMFDTFDFAENQGITNNNIDEGEYYNLPQSSKQAYNK